MNKYVIKPIDQQFVVEGKDKSDAMLNFAWDWFSNDLNDYFQVLDENGLKEETFEELDIKLDRLSDTARKFILWYLLHDWADDQEANLQNAKEPKNVSEFYAQEMTREDIKSARRIVKVLGYEIF